MRLVDTGQHAVGFIAIGQRATGVIAIGQEAMGVIAIGQVARGGIAIGMVAAGLVTVGMVSVGILYAGGFVGAGGRAGRGLIVPLVPKLGRRFGAPDLTTLNSLMNSRVWAGWIALRIGLSSSGRPVFTHQGRDLPLTLKGLPYEKVITYARTRPTTTYAFVIAGGQALSCTRLMDSGRVPWRDALMWLTSIGQVLALFALAVAFWKFIGVPLGDAIFGPGGILAST